MKKLQYEYQTNYQWLSSIILGAVNIEQSESLNFSTFENLFEITCLTSTRQQHIVLNLLATTENRFDLFIENAKFINLEKSPYFYYDPHSISYSGLKNILKGWCGSKGKATKVNYHDFIHSSSGEPAYFEIADNYLDMRDRFITVINNFNSKILNTPETQPTFIVDRGIYGKEKMIEINSNGFGLVTWDKDYKKDAWDEKLEINNFTISRAKNRTTTVKIWNISFIKDANWNKITGFHRLIVRIVPPYPIYNNIELPVLSNGKIDDQSAVYAILNRWLQENDFKYMIQHFGLNEITSYKSDTYSSLEGKLVEKKIYSDEYKYFSKGEKVVQNQLKKILLEKHNHEIKLKNNEKNKVDLFPKNEEIKELNNSLNKLKMQKNDVKEKINKAEKFIKENKEILVSDKKAYLDVIKITARNIFYKRIKLFNEFYNNKRNDHKILREIIRANGKIIYKNNKIIYELNPARRYAKKQFELISKFLAEISNELNLDNLDNLEKVICLKKQK